MRSFSSLWSRFWMTFAGRTPFGRAAAWLASRFTPPYYGRIQLATINRKGYISPHATISHRRLNLGAHVYIDDRVLIYQDQNGGEVSLADNVHLHRDTIIQTGSGGSVTIGSNSHIQARCQLSAYLGRIQIGQSVEVAPNCSFYPYNHGMGSMHAIGEQALWTKGGIFIDDGAWLGVGAIVLDGVRIGKGAVVGAGAVVVRSVPDDAIVAGVPARVITYRRASVPTV